MKQFETIPIRKPKKSVHDLSHSVVTTGNMADLMPVFLIEALPGDKFHVSTEMLLRMQPLISPMMHRVNAYIHFFQIPMRLIHSGWQEFLTGGTDGNVVVNMPKITGTNAQFNAALTPQSLADYLGIPVNSIPNNAVTAEPLSQLPFRAYQKVYNDWYMDKNLETPEWDIWDNLDLAINNANAGKLMTLRKRAWEKDYFTSCLPWAQRGDSVKLPISGSAPLRGNPVLYDINEDPFGIGSLVTDANGKLQIDQQAPTQDAYFNGNTAYADLSEASATTVNDLRRSYAVQRFLEKMARGGSRFYEYLLNIWGVKSSDARLQRSEFIGGGKLPVRIGEVLQTSETTDNSPQANMAGRGITGGELTNITRYVEEHSYIIGILSIIPRTSYFQGIPRIFSKFDRFQFYTPDFANIGEEPVYRKELYYGIPQQNNETFGYQPRYSDYRYMYDKVSGQMRSTMLHWTLARKFDANPLLNNSFVKCNPSTRIFAVENVQDYGQLVIQLYFNVKAIRPIAKFGSPI